MLMRVYVIILVAFHLGRMESYRIKRLFQHKYAAFVGRKKFEEVEGYVGGPRRIGIHRYLRF